MARGFTTPTAPATNRQAAVPRLVLAALALLGACGDSSTAPPPVPASLTVSPASLDFDALGDTAQLTATVVDQSGLGHGGSGRHVGFERPGHRGRERHWAGHLRRQRIRDGDRSRRERDGLGAGGRRPGPEIRPHLHPCGLAHGGRLDPDDRGGARQRRIRSARRHPRVDFQ